ncbi:MAG: peptidoglycan-binding protein [Patescibacteria group bacterium]
MTAKIFAALAVAGLVVSSVAAFAPTAGAQTTTTTTTTTSASVTFSRDLTIGSTGADVTALQNWLISKGHAIAAGATGYFGAQTQAALAAYQAANGISPAAGYFGPITRAKVNAGGSTSGGTGTGTGTGSTGGDLSGGEANLSDFDFIAEDSSGDEGEEGVEIATAEFDVEDADARVERVELTFDAASSTLDQKPWQYFDTIYVWADGDEIADIDASDRDEWDETTDDVYVISISGLDYDVSEGDMASLTFSADIAGSIDESDQDQSFDVYVDDEGIRAVDGDGIQQYIGDDEDEIDFDFGAQDNGDLQVKSSSEDPDSTILVADENDESEDYTAFVFDIENDGDADALITDITLRTATTSATLTNMVRTATLVVDGDEYDGDINFSTGAIEFEDIDLEIAGDDEVAFELMVSLKEDASTGTVTFSVANADVDAEGVDSGDDTTVTGSATGSAHTVALTGIAVEAVSTSETVVTPGDSSANTYATYTIKFDVTALSDDAYIASTTDATAAGFEGVTYTVYQDGAATTTFAGSAVLSSTADTSSGFFVVDEGDTETFTLTVTLNPTAAGTYEVDLSTISFNDEVAYSGETVFTIDTNDDDFKTNPTYIAN